jgi:hypothetical protein
MVRITAVLHPDEADAVMKAIEGGAPPTRGRTAGQ